VIDNIFYTSEEVARFMDDYSSRGMPYLFAFDYELNEGLFIESPHNQSEVLFKFSNGTNFRRDFIIENSQEHLKILHTDTLDTYRNKFNIIIQGLSRGDSYLANLTCKSRISTDLDPIMILSSTYSPFALYVPDRFLSFSPERFVKVENGIISSFPMKGTIDANIPYAESSILNNYKESSEHATITDLIRNDIGMVSDNVWVERYRYIDKISTDRGEILQVSSDIRGRLKQEFSNSLGSLILSLLPAGSISGAPKRSTVELIAKAEFIPRGFYTGIAGFFDGNSLDSAVLIRYIEFDKEGGIFYRSGGGITINSNVEEEYAEMINKIYLPLNR
jgi:para-aminobenzoate synthetase component 1